MLRRMVDQNNMQLAARKEEPKNNSRRGFLAGIATVIGMATGGFQPAYADGKYPIVGSENIMA